MGRGVGGSLGQKATDPAKFDHSFDTKQSSQDTANTAKSPVFPPSTMNPSPGVSLGVGAGSGQMCSGNFSVTGVQLKQDVPTGAGLPLKVPNSDLDHLDVIEATGGAGAGAEQQVTAALKKRTDSTPLTARELASPAVRNGGLRPSSMDQ